MKFKKHKFIRVLLFKGFKLNTMKSKYLFFVACLLTVVSYSCKEDQKSNTSVENKVYKKPNILFCIADDASFPHMGAYGTSWVKTPAFDRVASQGLLFLNAYTPNAKCAPSRSSILTGRNSWQLEEAANHSPDFPSKFSTYHEVLAQNGYFSGYTGKGWGPGNSGEVNGVARELTGSKFSDITTEPPTTKSSATDYSANFKEFIRQSPADEPWVFWYGGHEPHREYEFGSSLTKGGKSLSDIDKVPEFWPDNDTIRTDMLDYAYEIEYFDSHLMKMIKLLESKGQLDNTIIVITADNGMPFPRIKGQEYELSNHLPLAIMWPNGIKESGRKIDDFVSFIDFAPTFIDLAGLKWEETPLKPTPGRSLKPIFDANKFDAKHDNGFVVFGKERHDVGRPNDQGYPIRGIVKGDYIYIKNYEPKRWPAGNPETGYLNTDGSPTKTQLLDLRRSGQDTILWHQNFGKRPSEELFNRINDPLCLTNLAYVEDFKSIKENLHDKLVMVLTEQSDPRVNGNGEIFENYPYSGKVKNFYNRYMNGEKVEAGWVNETDFEKTPLD